MRKPVIVVVGAARSGTSLVMQALADAGGHLSSDVTSPSKANPRGPLEDRAFFALNREIYERMGSHHYLPVRCDELSAEDVGYIEAKFSEIAKREWSDGYVWLLKDPKATQLVPLWRDILYNAGFAPMFILAIREPTIVVESMCRYYSHSYRHGEVVWLVKNSSYLTAARNDCFVLPYDWWRRDPIGTYRCLVDHVNDFFSTERLRRSGEEHKVFDIKLERSAKDAGAKCSTLSENLYNSAVSADESTDRLLPVDANARENALRVRDYLHLFYGYVDVINKVVKDRQNQLRRRVERAIAIGDDPIG